MKKLLNSKPVQVITKGFADYIYLSFHKYEHILVDKYGFYWYVVAVHNIGKLIITARLIENGKLKQQKKIDFSTIDRVMCYTKEVA